jgi:predicted HTH transcriptional regulator
MITEAEIIELIKKAEEGPSLDYKEDLPLQSDGDKAEFVKDVIALANSEEKAHIVIGVEDGTGKPVGFKTPHTVEQINQILKDKCDPPISVEYVEKTILHSSRHYFH